MGRRAKQAVLRAVIAMYQHRGIPVVMIRGMRLPRIDRVDVPQHLAARTQDWLGQTAFDHLLAGRTGYETQAEAGAAAVENGRHGQPSGESGKHGSLVGAPALSTRPSVRLRDHRAGPGGVVRIAEQHPVPISPGSGVA